MSSATRMWRAPFRVTLVMLTVVLVGTTTAAVLWAVYVEARRAALDQASHAYALTAGSLDQRLRSLITRSAGLARLGAGQRSLDADTAALATDTPDEVRDLLTGLLSMGDDLYSVYYGRDDGAFVQLVSVGDDETLREQLGAPPGTRFLLREVFDGAEGRRDRRRFLDGTGSSLGNAVNEPGSYDPRQRPWFIGARESGEVFLTAPYVYNSTGKPGVTLAQAASTGVFGVDLTLTALQRFIAERDLSANGAIYLFDDTGQVWGSRRSDGTSLGLVSVEDSGDAALARLATLVRTDGRPASAFDARRLDYVSSWRAPAGRSIHVGMTAPTSDFTGFLDEATTRIVWLLGIVLALGIATIVWVSKALSSPLQHLTREAERVARFEFTSRGWKPSFIAEIDSLGRSFAHMTHALRTRTEALAESRRRLETLVETGIEVASERDVDVLHRRLLADALAITGAREGALLVTDESGELVLHRSSADTAGRDDATVVWSAVREAAQEKLPVRATELDSLDAADASAIAAAAVRLGAPPRSLLAVPMIGRTGEVEGVIQLLDVARRRGDTESVFTDEVEGFVKVLTSQASVALDSAELLDQQRALFEAIIELLAGAIDAKSPYTAGHCNRVPQLALWLADEASDSNASPFDGYALDDEARYEFRIGAWLHDCGKVTTPEYVVDKATKLETIYNRLHEVRTRFEVLHRDALVAALRARLDGEDEAAAMARYEREVADLQADFAFIAEANIGGEFMDEADCERVRRIADRRWTRHFDDRLGLSAAELELRGDGSGSTLPVEEPLLSNQAWHRIPRADGGSPWGDNPHGFSMQVPELLYDHGEVHNLCIARGTLTPEERFKINDHIIQTINMLEQLPFPPHLRRVPEIAGGHHETMVGTGYPRGLRREEMSVSARIMAIADIFEALTAADRPYKPAKTLSESLRIMARMRDGDHIDPDLFDLFLRSGVVPRYAAAFLEPSQVDEFDVEALAARG